MEAAPSAIAERAHAELERHGVPGAAFGVLRDGRTDAFAAGVRNVETSGAIGLQTPFRIASITKPFVATLALELVRAGKVSLDDPVGYGVTRRQALSHTGGVAIEWPRPLDPYGDDDEALFRLVADEP